MSDLRPKSTKPSETPYRCVRQRFLAKIKFYPIRQPSFSTDFRHSIRVSHWVTAASVSVTSIRGATSHIRDSIVGNFDDGGKSQQIFDASSIKPIYDCVSTVNENWSQSVF
jgi:hypothetical protein